MRTDDGHGNIELSKKEANEVLAWDKLREMMEQQTVVTVRIKESVPSGVVAFLEGIRAFIPASQLSADYVEDTDAWIGKDVRVVVITVDPEKNKLVLSGKVVARQEREEERNHRIAMLVPGSVVEGTVESIMPYGAFINIGNGISGLVHISQISQKRISSVHEVLKEGQKVKPGTKLLKFDKSFIESEGFDTACVFVLTNCEDFPDVRFFTGQDVVQNETVICSF